MELDRGIIAIPILVVVAMVLRTEDPQGIGVTGTLSPPDDHYLDDLPPLRLVVAAMIPVHLHVHARRHTPHHVPAPGLDLVSRPVPVRTLLRTVPVPVRVPPLVLVHIPGLALALSHTPALVLLRLLDSVAPHRPQLHHAWTAHHRPTARVSAHHLLPDGRDRGPPLRIGGDHLCPPKITEMTEEGVRSLPLVLLEAGLRLVGRRCLLAVGARGALVVINFVAFLMLM
jgi:hypothetical protein